MKAINIIGAALVLLANLAVSYNHSIQLFQSGGFTGWMAHVAVIGAETTFILGALNLVVSRLRGESPGAPAILGGLLGVGLVSWSNVAAGVAYGWTGILLGLATPASLMVAEAILSRAIIQSHPEGVESHQEALENHPESVENHQEVLENHQEELESMEDPLKVAREVLEAEGELPTRRQLMDLAQCSEWKARKALQQLREAN